ncbi:MAG: hypothetical protein IT578_04645 [Verrucomicrobiae bacterium]|nr:hypothetical protein [Verrucomicrobiae bacterium]
MRSHPRSLSAVALLVLIPLALLAPLVLRFGSVTMGDHELVAKLGLLKAIREGGSPFWTEALDCGTLLLGCTSMPWTLGDLSFLIFGSKIAHNLSALADLVLAGVGFFLWRRRSWGNGPAASLLGAITYQLSLHPLSQLSVGHQVVTAQYACLPWGLWCLDLLAAGDRLRFLGLFPWIIFLMAMATYPATTLIFGLVMALYFGWRILARERRVAPRLSAFALFLGASLLGLAGAAFIYVPALTFASHCVLPGNPEHNIPDYFNHLTLPPPCLATLALPYLFGGSFTEPTFWSNYLSPANTGAPHEFAIYCGLLPLWLVWTQRSGIRRSSEATFWTGIALLLLVVAIGRWGGLYSLFRHLPIMENLRGSCRFIVAFPLACACLAAWGADRYAQAPEPERDRLLLRLPLWLIALVTIACAFLLGALFADGALARWHPATTPSWFPRVRALVHERIVAASASDLRMVASFAGIWGLLFLGAGRRFRTRPGFLCALAVADLAFNAWPMLWKPSGNATLYLRGHPLSRALTESCAQGRTRFADLDFSSPHNLALLNGSLDAAGFRDFVPRWHMQLVRKSNGENPCTYDLYNYGLFRTSPLLSLMRVDTVVARNVVPPPPWREVERVEGVGIFRGPAVPPEAWLPRRVLVVPDPMKRLDELEKLVAPDPAGTAVIEKNLDLPEAAGEVASVLKTGPLEYTIRFKEQAQGLLCTAIGWYPDWKAFYEKTPLTTVRVNHAFLGARLDHPLDRVTLRFVPNAHFLGIRVSCLAFGVWLMAVGTPTLVRVARRRL